MLDYMYEGYGYDLDDPRIYFEENLKEQTEYGVDEYNTNGMKSLQAQDGVCYEDQLPTEEANEYTQIGQFISENGHPYTDLRQGRCKCE